MLRELMSLSPRPTTWMRFEMREVVQTYEIHWNLLLLLLLFHIAEHRLEFIVLLLLRGCGLLAIELHELVGGGWAEIDCISIGGGGVDRVWCGCCGISLCAKGVLCESDCLFLSLFQGRIEQGFL